MTPKNSFMKLQGIIIHARISAFALAMLAIAGVPLSAQTFTVLHTLTGGDGALPFAGLIISGNTLYGTAEKGGSSGVGTVFKMNTNGMGFTILHSFTATTGSFANLTNSDGAYPQDGLIISGNTLYGT